MARSSWRHQMDRLLAAAQDGVIRAAELVALGVDSSVIYKRCRPGGPWQKVLSGVILLQSGPATWRQRMRAGLVFGGEHALLTGAAAVNLHGLRRAEPRGTVHLLVPEPVRRRSTGFVVVERTRRLPEPVTLQGFDAAPAIRALVDHTRGLGDRKAVQAVVAEAVQRGFCDARDVLAELDAGSCRGTALVREELVDILGGAKSVAEVGARRLVARSRLPQARWNVRLTTGSGCYVAEPDAWWDDVGLAWEIDSHEYHLSPTDHARTLRRNARYTAHGIEYLETLPSRLTSEPAVVLAELEAAHASAARRRRPCVIAS